MRDRKRIKPFLVELEKFWESKPDLRFWQIVEYLNKSVGKKDPFFVEDDYTKRVIEALNRMVEQ
jgi:uncharacterized protein YihD (DUF1040 family)